MEEHTRAAPRLMTAAAIALVVAALAAFAYLAGGGVAGAADTSGGGNAASSGQLRPVQESGDENAPPERGGHPCPEEEGGLGLGRLRFRRADLARDRDPGHAALAPAGAAARGRPGGGVVR